MLKRMILKKITITALTLFILLLIYLMPTNKINNRNLTLFIKKKYIKFSSKKDTGEKLYGYKQVNC